MYQEIWGSVEKQTLKGKPLPHPGPPKWGGTWLHSPCGLSIPKLGGSKGLHNPCRLEVIGTGIGYVPPDIPGLANMGSVKVETMKQMAPQHPKCHILSSLGTLPSFSPVPCRERVQGVLSKGRERGRCAEEWEGGRASC